MSIETLTDVEKIIRRIEAAESIALAGSPEHDMYVKAALMLNWPRIKFLLRQAHSGA